MIRIRALLSLTLPLAVAACAACTGPAENGPPPPASAPEPRLADDMDRTSLRQALERSLEFIRKLPPDRALALGAGTLSVAELRETLETFGALLETHPDPADFSRDYVTTSNII